METVHGYNFSPASQPVTMTHEGEKMKLTANPSKSVDVIKDDNK